MDRRALRSAFVVLCLSSFVYGSLGREAFAQEVKEETSGPETKRTFELRAGEASRPFARPDGAAFFWWNAPPGVRVRLKFSDGSATEVDASESFEKEIVEVIFVNSSGKQAAIELLSMN